MSLPVGVRTALAPVVALLLVAAVALAVLALLGQPADPGRGGSAGPPPSSPTPRTSPTAPVSSSPSTAAAPAVPPTAPTTSLPTVPTPTVPSVPTPTRPTLPALPTVPVPTGSPGAAPALAILPLGDSITYGLSLGQAVTPGGYRGYLSTALDAAGVAHRFVGTTAANPPAAGTTTLDPSAFLHDGWPGARVDQVRDAVVGPSPLDGGSWFADTAARPALAPDVVVVHLGTNDIGQAHDPRGTYPGGYDDADPSDRAVFARHLGRRIRGLVGDIRAQRPGTAVVVCTLVPMPGDTDAAFDRVVRRDVVPRLDQPGAPAVLADVAREFPSDPGLLADSIHPTAVGYQAMGATIARAVTRVSARVRPAG